MAARSRVLSLALLAGVVAVSSALASGKDTSFTVTSSLDGKTALPLRSHWIAAMSAPYYYGDNGNWLVTSFIKPGLHTFTVRALTANNQVAIDKFQARVIPPPQPPAKLAGRWTPAGRTLLIAKNGWGIGPDQWVDAEYPPNGNVVLGPLIIDRPEQTPGFAAPTRSRTGKSGSRPAASACSSPRSAACSVRVATFKGLDAHALKGERR